MALFLLTIDVWPKILLTTDYSVVEFNLTIKAKKVIEKQQKLLITD